MVAPEFKFFLQLSYKNLAKIYHNVQEYVPPANAGRWNKLLHGCSKLAISLP